MWSALWEETKTGGTTAARSRLRQYVRWEYGEADPTWLLRLASQRQAKAKGPGFLARARGFVRSLASRNTPESG